MSELFLEKLLKPIETALEWTCPDCRILEPKENWYPLTFLISFSWITFFSYFVTIIASNWVHLLEVPSLLAYFGIVLVAVGAEVPDAINSVTVAKRGYGSMSTSSCMGSQIANICLGLGMGWFLVSVFGDLEVQVGVHDELLTLVSWCQLFNICLVYAVTVGTARGKENVVLTRFHVYLFASMYVFVILAFGIYAVRDVIR